jgi:hypothetical protein
LIMALMNVLNANKPVRIPAPLLSLVMMASL